MSRRGRLILLACVLLVLAALAAGTLRLAGSERGAAWLSGAVQRALPGLLIEGQGGTLLEGHIGRLRWQGEGETVSLHDITWQLERGCILRFSLCARSLAARSLEIELTASTDDSPLDLSPLSLPVDIDVAYGSLGSLLIRREARELLRIDDIGFAASLLGSRVDVASLEAKILDVELRASGRVDIEKQLPLAATASATRAGWPTLTASVKGDLTRLAVEAKLAGDWPLAMSGTVDPLGEEVPFSLGLRAEAPLALPGEAAAYGSLQEARATLAGNLLGISAELQASTGSEWIGVNRLQAMLRWAPKAGVELQRASLQGELGMVEATGTLGLGAALPLQLALQLRDACLPRWAQTPGCRVGGTVRTEGTLAENATTLTAVLDLTGEVKARPAALRGRVAMDAAGALMLEGVELASGANRLQLAGTAGDLLALEGQLQLASLAETLPRASGHGEGRFRIGGNRARPEIDASLQLAQLAAQGYRAGELAATLRWRGEGDTSNRLALQASALGVPGLDIGAVDAVLTGSRASHALTASGRIEGVAIALACAGAAADANWSANCQRLDLTTRQGLPDWQLEQSLRLAWNGAAKSLSVEPFCLRSKSTAACSTQRVRIAPDLVEGIALRAEALPVGFLSAWLPPDLEASGTLALRLDASRRGTQPLRLEASLSSQALRLEPLAAGEEIPFEFREIAASLRTEGRGLRLRASALSGAEGRIEAALDLSGLEGAAGLSGSVSVAGIEVGPVLRIVPGSLESAGRLDGRITVGGSVASPALSGEIGVTGGRFAHEGLPQPIEDFSLALRFAGADADFDGSLRTRAGTGNIDGKFRWAGEDWSARLRLHAQELLLEPRRGTRIHVVPDITVELDPALASISGEVRIPKADIDLEALPETAVSVSRDTVMVGQQKAAPGIDYALSVKLSLGKQVQLRGFGADARLGGELRLLRNPDAPIEGRGEVRILEGRYTAYGQRLEVTEGSSLVFNGPLTRPALRINAVRHIEDEPVEVGVQVRGDAKAPELKVFSRPTMPESRALHYLLTGRAPSSGTDNELAVGSAMMQLGISGAGKVTSKIFGKLGIQDFQVDSRKVQGGTEVQLSGYLTPDLYLRYGVSTFEKVNTFRLRYRLTPRFFVEAVSGVENAVDFLYSFSR